jgi:AcrR family transcriptional regulator
MTSNQNHIRIRDAADAPAGRLARRKARTRAAILGAASRLFHEQGFQETSIQQIADAADSGVGTVYGYFASKDDVLREVLRLHSDEAIERYKASIARDTSSIDRVCLALDTFAQYIKENRSILLAAFQTASRSLRLDEQPTEWLLGVYSGLIQGGIDRGELRPVPVESTARMLIGTFMMAMLGIGIWRGRESDPTTLADLMALTRQLLATSC